MSKKEQRLEEWRVKVANYKASGLTIQAWCTANACTKEKLKYWLRRTTTSSSTNFVPVNLPSAMSASVLTVQIGSARIDVHPGFDPQLLCEIIRTLEMKSC